MTTKSVAITISQGLELLNAWMTNSANLQRAIFQKQASGEAGFSVEEWQKIVGPRDSALGSLDLHIREERDRLAAAGLLKEGNRAQAKEIEDEVLRKHAAALKAEEEASGKTPSPALDDDAVKRNLEANANPIPKEVPPNKLAAGSGMDVAAGNAKAQVAQGAKPAAK